MGSALQNFNDFMTATGPAYLTSAEDVINEAVKRNYLLRRFLKGRSMEEVLQGGRSIRDDIIFDEQNTAQTYQPNETFTWTNPQVLTEWEISWRFIVDHMSWTDQEIELNSASGRNARHQMYKRLKRVKEQRLWTSLLNFMEDLLFAVPEVADMETATGQKPYSIPAFINEQANGLFYATANVTGKTAWTTVEGIDPTLYPGWAPQVARYNTGLVNSIDSGGTSVNDKNIIDAFDEMWYLVRFEPPPTQQQYFESADLYGQFIACSRRGLNEYKRLLRLSQDQFVTSSRQDPDYAKPRYAGIELEYVASLDTALLYEAETATNPLVKEIEAAGTGDANGPRYYWINSKYLRPVFHTSRYMFRHPVKTHPNQPFTHVMPVDCWLNMVCRSRQRLGIVAPAATVDVYVP